MTRRRIPAIWFCQGCGKHHKNTREISGEIAGQYWCDNAIRRGVRNLVNRLPYHSYKLVDGNVVDSQGNRCNPR